jgi:hypothetical protein
VVGAGAGSAVVNQIIKGKSMSDSNKRAIQESKQSDSDRKTANEVAIEAARRQLLPSYDENAVKPEKVYNAREIAGEKAWNKVYNKVFACLRQDEDPIDHLVESINEKSWVDFTLRYVKHLTPDSPDVEFRLTCAILTNWMVKFYNSNHDRKSFEGIQDGRATFYGIPVEVAARCFELFATPITGGANGKGTFVMSKQNKEKMIVHILLLFMIAHGPSMKIPALNHIAECLKISLNECTSILRYAGCTITKKGAVFGAVLKTPLEFPSISRGRGPPRGR